MIKLFVYVGSMFCLATHISVAQEKPVVDSSYANGYYLERLDLFQKLSGRKEKVVFLGNSITEAGNWEDRRALSDVANRGISGDNSFGVYYRIDDVLSDEPEKLFLMIGVNDLKRGNPVEYILKNHERIARAVSANSSHFEFYIQSILPVREAVLNDIYSNITNEKIQKVNDGLLEIADQFGIPYIDLNNAVFSDDKGELIQKFTTDGLHLSEQGYRAWIDYLDMNKFLLKSK